MDYLCCGLLQSREMTSCQSFPPQSLIGWQDLRIVVYSMQYTIKYTVYTVYYTIYSIQYTLCTIQYTVYSIHSAYCILIA